MPNKRIAIFIPTLEGGGAELSMIALAKGLCARGYSVDLLVKNTQGELRGSIPANIRLIDFNVPTMRYTLGKLITYIKNEHPEAIISAMELSNLSLTLASLASKQRPKTIITIHNTLSLQPPIYNRNLDRILFGLMYRFSNKIVCVSDTCAKDTIKYLHLPKAKVFVINNPILNDDIYIKAKEIVSYPWFPGSDRKRILSIGRLVPQKDHKNLIKAFKLVRDVYEAQLIILGEGYLRLELIELSEALGVDQDVSLPGFIQNPYPLIAQSDVFVLSSIYEGFGNVLVEALAVKCPVVSTDCLSGPREILAHGKYGHLVSVGDSQEMADAILEVIAGDKRLAPSDWLDQYHVDHSVDQYVRLIEAQD